MCHCSTIPSKQKPCASESEMIGQQVQTSQSDFEKIVGAEADSQLNSSAWVTVQISKCMATDDVEGGYFFL